MKKKAKPEKTFLLIDPDTWEIAGKITRRELIKIVGAGNVPQLQKLGRFLLAEE